MIDKVGTHKFQRGRLFDRLLLSEKVNTTTLENYARLCFFQRTTLQDELGEEFGFDFLAPSQIGDDGNPKYPKVLIDAKGYLNTLAIVAHPRDFSRDDYVFDDVYKDEAHTIKKPQSQASVTSQQIANQFLLEGKKTIHLVLNDFDYFKLQTPYDRDSKQLQAVIAEETQIIDGSKISVNPLQPFARNLTDEKEEEMPAYRRTKKKFNAIVQALINYQGEDSGIADKVFDELMVQERLWNTDNDVMVKRRNYLGLPAIKYPAFDRVITQFTTKARLFRQNNEIKEAEETKRIQRKLDSFLTNNRSLIGATTTLKLDRSKVNYYINLNNLDRLQKNIQVMNLFDFVTEFLDAGDLIILHGADQLDIRTSDYLRDQFERTFDKKVRILLSYDVTDSLEPPKRNELGTSSVFTMNGRLFDFNLGVDFSFIGRMDNPRNYEEMVNAELSERTKVDIGYSGSLGRSMFYRSATKTLHLMGLKPVC